MPHRFCAAALACVCLTTIGGATGCQGDGATPAAASIRSKTQAVCAGNTAVITPDKYIGEQEEVTGGFQSLDVGHAADLELIDSHPLTYAAFWIHQDGAVRATVYDATLWQVTTTTTLAVFPTGTRKWVRRAGWGQNCTAFGAGVPCAWVTWEDWGGFIWWVAVRANGALGSYHGWIGHDPSGDEGFHRENLADPGSTKKLLTYIADGAGGARTLVKGMFLDDGGNVIGSPFTIYTLTDTGYRLYQTATAYSGYVFDGAWGNSRWVVAWAEDPDPPSLYRNGRIKTAYVKWDGTVSGGQNHIMYCEGGPFVNNCGTALAPPPPQDAATKPAPLDGGVFKPAWYANTRCVCKGFWLGNGGPDASDVYRLQHYGTHVRLNLSGTPYTPNEAPEICEMYCPVGPSENTSSNKYYTMIRRKWPSSSEQIEFDKYTFNYSVTGTLHSAEYVPQAVRAPKWYYSIPTAHAGASLAAGGTNRARLTLSMFGMQTGSCPPSP